MIGEPRRVAAALLLLGLSARPGVTHAASAGDEPGPTTSEPPAAPQCDHHVPTPLAAAPSSEAEALWQHALEVGHQEDRTPLPPERWQAFLVALRAAAEAGHPEALDNLGWYVSTEQVPGVEVAAAHDLYARAFSAGSTMAAARLGQECIDAGDRAGAFQWWTACATRGAMRCVYLLVDTLSDSQEVADLEASMPWLEVMARTFPNAAADDYGWIGMGFALDSSASYRLCELYADGPVGIQHDLVRAYAWCLVGNEKLEGVRGQEGPIAYADRVRTRLNRTELAAAVSQAETILGHGLFYSDKKGRSRRR